MVTVTTKVSVNNQQQKVHTSNRLMTLFPVCDVIKRPKSPSHRYALNKKRPTPKWLMVRQKVR
jgi:hypothetical protein